MAALRMQYLLELEEYLRSGNLKEDFFYSPEERRHEILEFLEKLMDVAELADETATKIIFRKAE
jgi:phosphopantothenate synthetase